MRPLRIASLAFFAVALALFVPNAMARGGHGGRRGGGGGGAHWSHESSHGGSSSVYYRHSAGNGHSSVYYGPPVSGPRGTFFTHRGSSAWAHHNATFTNHALSTTLSPSLHHGTAHLNAPLSLNQSATVRSDRDRRDPDHDGDIDRRHHDEDFFDDSFIGPDYYYGDYYPYYYGGPMAVTPFYNSTGVYNAPRLAGAGLGSYGYAVTAAPSGEEAGFFPGSIDYFAPMLWYSYLSGPPMGWDWHLAYLGFHLAF